MINHNIRWEIRFEYVSEAIKYGGIISYPTRKTSRAVMRIYKNNPQYYSNVRMYQVSEYLDGQGEPLMTLHKRAR
ncbi:MAG: hypothetical protein ACRC6V_05010 [Bacteroidales bacterium]